jgi:glycine/serine hydroxymethyltransferase
MSIHAFFSNPLSASDPAVMEAIGGEMQRQRDQIDRIGVMILEVLEALRANPGGDAAVEQRVRAEVSALCHAFPIY